ncbi:AsnC family transcriptional regulator, partial [Acinetobacter nosocomialis]|uniref:AsnC family transcriptional regulator n=1 Tax=Acinetobacter nosocomialis TaxID=106654 RepID=UPI00208FC33F
LMTVFGGWIADNWLGQARAVWYGSIIIALGHLSIALTTIFDQIILGLLKDNARMSVTEIAEKVHVSRATVKKRMEYLESSG